MAETAKNDSTQQPSAKGSQDGQTGTARAQVAPNPARLEQAREITRRNVLWALGAGVVPFPVADVLAVMAVQVKLLREFSTLYGVSFTEGVAKKLAATLLSSIGIVGIGSVVGGSLAKLIPGVGTALGLVSVPLLAGMVTHATGKVFTMHFESGGTLLDFDPKAMREYFKQEFEKAREVVSQIQHDKAGNKPA
jgi:uncharacterized protein (DUF697 family)